MGLQIESEQCEGYLKVQVRGQHDPDNIRPFVNWVASKVQAQGPFDVLIDLRSLEGAYSEWDRFQAGLAVSEVWGARVRAAIVYPYRGGNKFFENVAVNRGARVRIVQDEQEALAWLKATPGSGEKSPIAAHARGGPWK